MNPTAPAVAPIHLLRTWILERNVERDPGELVITTPLIAERWLTSLQLPEFLLYLEELRATPVDPATLTAGAFHDLETIHARFLQGTTP